MMILTKVAEGNEESRKVKGKEREETPRTSSSFSSAAAMGLSVPSTDIFCQLQEIKEV